MASPNLSVFYDGDCPICVYEVHLYTRMDGPGHIDWVDIEGLTEADLPEGKSREDLLGRFHARDSAGGWHVGVDAFDRIWRELPYLRRMAWAFRVPGIRQLTELAYRAFLRWQQRDRRRRKAMAERPTA